MSFIRKFTLGRYQRIYLAAFLLLAHASDLAASTMPIFDLNALKGIDTVVVERTFAGEHTLLPTQTPKEEDIVLSSVKQIFAKYSWITVKAAGGVPSKEWSLPNVLFLEYAVLPQQEHVNGIPIKIAALGLQLRTFTNERKAVAIPFFPAAYAFILPDTAAAFSQRLAEGIKYLTSYVPGYIACSNRYGHPSDSCPACSLQACTLERPFRATLPPACPPPAPDQTVPTPCGSME